MSSGRSLPLFDPSVQPSTWNERMARGEFAVHASTSKSASPCCMVFPSLEQAEQYAQQQITLDPALRCRIYSHEGFVGAPVAEFRGKAFKSESDLSPRIRRWLGAAFLVVGTVMVLVDWHSDFRLTWPAVVGSRLLIPGLLLFITEALIQLQARYGNKREPGTSSL